MKYIKSFETTYNTKFLEGDFVKFKSSELNIDDIYVVWSSQDNESLLYFYTDYQKFINDEIDELDGIGWIDNNELEEVSEKDINIIIGAKKYNL